jgi:hypothetical protein
MRTVVENEIKKRLKTLHDILIIIKYNGESSIRELAIDRFVDKFFATIDPQETVDFDDVIEDEDASAILKVLMKRQGMLRSEKNPVDDFEI